MAEIESKEIVFWNTELYLHNTKHPTTEVFEPLNPEASQLFSNVLDTPLGIRAIQVLRKHPKHRSPQLSSVAGRLFEEICLPWVQTTLGPKFMVLSSDETAKVFKLANPEREAVRFYKLNNALQGISLPNYLILQTSHDQVLVNGWCECQLGSYNHKVRSSFITEPRDIARNLGIYSNGRGVSMGQILLGSMLPEVRGGLLNLPITMDRNPRIFYVQPQGLSVDFTGVTTLNVPFNGVQFGGFLDALLLDCQN